MVDANQAAQIRKLYEGYLSGLSLAAAAKEAGLILKHAGVKRLLTNKHYLGDGYYPAIIDQETYDKAEAELQRRAKRLGRLERERKPEEKRIPTKFRMLPVNKDFADPFEQAAYIYSLIESEG